MKKLSIISITILSVFFYGLSCVHPKSDSEINTIAVADKIYLLESAGSGNVGASIGKDGILIIDDKFAESADNLKATISNLSKNDIKFVINTHWHNDHTGANEIFGKDAVIIAHENVRTRLSNRQELKILNRVYEPKPEQAWPVITFNQSITIYFNDEEIKVIHFQPGHTDGDSVVFFTKSNVVHTGDLFFNGWYPFIDLDSYGNIQGYTNNVEQLISMIPPDAKIIPGHGPLADLDDFKIFHNMLVQTSTIIKNKLDEGKTLEELKKAGLPEEIEQKWGHGFLPTDKWIEIIYRSYSRE